MVYGVYMDATTYAEQSTEALREIVATTEAQIAFLATRPGSEQVMGIAQRVHERAAAELASR